VWQSGLALTHWAYQQSYCTFGSIGFGMDDCLWADKPLHLTSHPGQLSFLLYMGEKVSTGQRVMILKNWKGKAGMVHCICE